jgi:hypothetical protein
VVTTQCKVKFHLIPNERYICKYLIIKNYCNKKDTVNNQYCSKETIDVTIGQVERVRVESGQFDSVRLLDHGSDRVGYRIISCFGSYQVEWSQLSGHLISGHFKFQVVSARVGPVIGSSSVGSSRVSSHNRSSQINYRVI